MKWYVIICKFLSLLCAVFYIMGAACSYNNPKHRFFSLKSSEANLRVGPGEEYPIAWILTKVGLPMMLLAEFNNWRKIKLMDNTEGWIHMNIISRKKTAVVMPNNHIYSLQHDSISENTKYNKINDSPYAIMYKYRSNSYPIAKVEKNVIATVLKIEENWVKIEINKIKGWIEKENLWGVD